MKKVINVIAGAVAICAVIWLLVLGVLGYLSSFPEYATHFKIGMAILFVSLFVATVTKRWGP